MVVVAAPDNKDDGYTLETAPFNASNQGQTILMEDIPTLAYNDGFQWRSAADNSILNTANSAFLESNSYKAYQNVPLFAGDITQLKTLFAEATTSFKDVLIFGDSQETAPGGFGSVFIPAINLEAFKRFGAPAKTPWYSLFSFDELQTYCIGAVIAEAPLLAETVNDPPSVVVKEMTGTGLGPLACLIPDGGINTTLTELGGTFFPADTGSVYYEFLAITNTSGPAQIRVRGTTSATKRNYFGTVENNFIFSATDMSATNGDIVNVSVGPLTYNASRPFINIFSQGWDGAAVQTGHQMSIARFSDTSRNQGVAFTSWSSGGQTVANLLLKTGIGPTTQTAGPWDLIMILLGTNTGGSGTIENQKTRYVNLLTQIRIWTGNANQFVLFVSEPPRETFNSQLELDLYLSQAAQMGEIAQENDNVAFVNLGAQLLSKYPEFGVSQANGGTFLNDTVHLTNDAAKIAAQEFWLMVDALP